MASFGRLVASLSSGVTFVATETKTIHTITPTDGRVTDVYIYYRAVSLPIAGNGGSSKSELFCIVQKNGGVVSVPQQSVGLNQKQTPVNLTTPSTLASGGNLLIRFATSGAAAILTRCDVYVDEAVS